MSGLQVKIDIEKMPGGHNYVAWGLRATGPANPKTDELWLLYSLEACVGLPDPRKYAVGVTHELTAYSLDGTKIDFDKSLWLQKQLRPELPALVALQFKAAGDNDALMEVQGMMTRMLRGRSHMPTTHADWESQFPGCVWVPRSPENEASEALRVAKIVHPD